MTRAAIALAALACAAASAVAADEAWFPSRWDAADEIGALNNVTPARVLEAAKLVRTGKVYSLAIETSSKTPGFPPRTFHLTVVQPMQAGGGTLGPTLSTYNDDLVTGWNGTGSQIDGLGHVGINYVHYNGHQVADFVAADGWLSLLGSDDRRFMAGAPGLGREGAYYLADRNITAVGADNFAVEVVPFEAGSGQFEIHQAMLAKKGIFLLEFMNTARLAADGAYEFLFVLGQPRIAGAVQAIVNPVAMR
jgi:hypothetical protein